MRAHFTKIHSNPLEYCEKNCLLYEQGRIDLVWRDWQLLGDAKTKQLDRCVSKLLDRRSHLDGISSRSRRFTTFIQRRKTPGDEFGLTSSYFFRDENAIPRAATATTCGTRPKYNMPSCLTLYINYEDASRRSKTRAT